MLRDEKYVALKRLDLTRRLEWFEHKAPAGERVKYRTGRRYLERAIGQIAEQIVGAGYKPVVADDREISSSFVPTSSLLTELGSQSAQLPAMDAVPHSTGQPTTPAANDTFAVLPGEGSSARKRRRTRWMAVASITAAGLLIVTTAVIFKPSNPGGGAKTGAAPTTATMRPAGASATNGPVRADSVAYIRDGGDSSYAFARNLKLTSADLAGLNRLIGDKAGYEKWALNQGGVNPFDAKIQIALRGNSSQTVVITDVQVAARCGKPLTGTLLYSPAAGPNGDAGIRFDLDKPHPVAQDANDDDAYFAGPNAHTISLAPGEVTTLLIDALTARQHCDFSLNLIVATGQGQPVAEKIDNHGTPFQVTAIANGTGSSPLKYADYQAVYAGGVASPSRDDRFASVNPATVH